MKIQIYTMQSVEEALAVIAQGVDHVGITPSKLGLPGEIDLHTARAITEAVADSALVVALSVDSNLEAIVAMVQTVGPDILHLCGLEDTIQPEGVLTLRDRLPEVPIMQAISVSGPGSLEKALAYQDVADTLILDTQSPDIAGIGASGETHDWEISRTIVEQVKIPVILAGGLSPENVRQAIDTVQPWGVDSLTHTNQYLPEGGFRKDLARVREFVNAVRDVS
jgi:phosphoribosylanthranilate isomerase